MPEGSGRMERRVEDLNPQGAVGGFTADWRGEVVAACLGELGYDKGQVLFKRVGSSRRGYAREVEEMRLVHTGAMAYGSYLEVEINRASIYDSMPEGLFHRPLHQGREKDKRQAIEEIHGHTAEEDAVRRFMRLFEVEVDGNLAETQLRELRFDKRDKYRDSARVFEPYWQVMRDLPLRQANLLLRHLPHFHSIRANPREIGRALSAILEVPVSVAETYTRLPENAGGVAGPRGRRLGLGATLRGGAPDGSPDFVVTVGGLPADGIRPFLRGAGTRRALEWLCGLLLPANARADIRLTALPGERKAHLGLTGGHPCYLGVNSRLDG